MYGDFRDYDEEELEDEYMEDLDERYYLDEYAEEPARGRGRPRKIDARRNQVLVKMNNIEMSKLQEACFALDTSTGDVLRTAFDYWYRNKF